jgi:hypothetical protein
MHEILYHTEIIIIIIIQIYTHAVKTEQQQQENHIVVACLVHKIKSSLHIREKESLSSLLYIHFDSSHFFLI